MIHIRVCLSPQTDGISYVDWDHKIKNTNTLTAKRFDNSDRPVASVEVDIFSASVIFGIAGVSGGTEEVRATVGWGVLAGVGSEVELVLIVGVVTFTSTAGRETLTGAAVEEVSEEEGNKDETACTACTACTGCSGTAFLVATLDALGCVWGELWGAL